MGDPADMLAAEKEERKKRIGPAKEEKKLKFGHECFKDQVQEEIGSKQVDNVIVLHVCTAFIVFWFATLHVLEY